MRLNSLQLNVYVIPGLYLNRDRWPNAHIQCVDSSNDMLSHAKEYHERVFGDVERNITYHRGNFENFNCEEKVDLIYSNAALHWVSFDIQQEFLPRYMSLLKPGMFKLKLLLCRIELNLCALGGHLAFQIPDSRQQNSHIMMRKAAEELGLDQLLKVRWVTCNVDPDAYYSLLRPYASNFNMWSTEFVQILKGDNPVVDFTSSTGLGPYLEALGGKGTPDGQAFFQKYSNLIANAYPKQSDGTTIFPMKRFFLVAQAPNP